MSAPMNDLGIVRRKITRADKAAVDKLSRFGVATIHEAMGRVGLMQHYMRPIYAGAHMCGTAVTVLLQPGDNWMMHVAAEQIQPGFDYTSWAAMFTTGGTPREIVDKLAKPMIAYAHSPEGIAKANAQGDELVGSTPDELARMVAREVPRWKQVVRDNNIKAEE